MSLSGWNENKKYRLTFDRSLIDEDLTDVVVPVILGTSVGKTNFDISAVFDDIGVNDKKIAFEVGDTGVQCYGEIVEWNASGENAHIEVKLPSISAVTGCVLNFYYDSAHADNDTITILEASDDFTGVNGDLPRSDLWEIKHDLVTDAGLPSTTAGVCTIQDNSLDFSTIDAHSLPLAVSLCKVSGNFDVQVDWSIDSRTSSSSWSVAMTAGNGNDDFTNKGSSTKYTLTGMYKDVLGYLQSTYNESYVNSVSTDTSGKFKITRVGSTVTNYYWDGSDWISLVVDSSFGIDSLYIKLSARTYGGDPKTLNCNFDNFIINSADSITGFIGDTNSHPSDIVHSDRAFVSHQAQDPSGTAPQILDSSPNAKHGTSYGTMLTEGLVDGLVGNAIGYDGIDDYTNHGYDAAHDITDLLTIRAVIKPNIFIDAGSSPTDGFGIVDRRHTPAALEDTYGFVINDLGRLHLGSQGGSAQSTKDTWEAGTIFVVCATCDYNGGSELGSLFVNGIKEILIVDTLDPMVGSENDLVIGSSNIASPSFPGIIDEVLIVNAVMSDAWMKVDNAALRDNLITFSEVFPVIMTALGQYYNLSRDPVLSALAQGYHMTIAVENSLSQIWALILEQFLVQHYGNADQILAALTQHYHGAPQVQRALVQKYDDMVQLSAALEQKYNLMFRAEAALVQEWAICGTPLSTALVQEWDHRLRNEIIAALGQYWGLFRDSQDVQAPLFWVMADGVLLNPSEITWTLSTSFGAIQATITLPDQGVWRSIQLHGGLEIHWSGTTYELFVEEKSRTRSITADKEYRVDYLLHGLSLTAGLEAPYANTVTKSYPVNTMASVIVADLAESIPVDWQITDFPVYANTFSVDNETPLTAIKRLVGNDTVRAIVQTSPEGQLIVRRKFPKSPSTWKETTADHVVNDDGGLFSDSDNRDVMPGYNYVEISNQAEDDAGKRLEEETISATSKRVRGYSVPWEDDFPLVASGGDWVDVVDNGTLTEIIAEELVEFVDGSGSVSKPVYDRDRHDIPFPLQITWLREDLGFITAAEDGSLISEIPGNSLAKISYLTKYREWIVHDQQIESVQVFIPDLGEAI